MKREVQLQHLKSVSKFDILVIGGGASGLGVALDAVSRGLKVALVEKYDFGKGTSSRSTKLIHGGVRYLEQGNIALVKEALREREYILDKADHISRVQPFIVPCYSWFMCLYYYVGLKVYDVLSGSKTIGKTSWLGKEEVLNRIPNVKVKSLAGGIQYMDGQFDDTRLCIDLASTIVSHGGNCINHAGASSLLKKEGKVIGATITDELSGDSFDVKADYVVNAAGIFTDDVVQMDAKGSRKTIIPSRGSHIVLEQSFLGGTEAIMIPKTSDGRVLFIIPWNGKVIVGTTDEKTETPVAEPKATPEEINFILKNCQEYLTKKPVHADILSTFAGLRPLATPKEGSQKTKEISRGHKVIFSDSGMVSIIGGKWTTFRKMGEDVVKQINKKWNAGFKKSTSLDMDIMGQGVYSKTGLLHPSLPYSETDFDRAIEEEMAMSLEDLLCRRTRCIFLDAAATEEIMEQIGKKLQLFLGKSDKWLVEEVTSMRKLLDIYKA